MYQPGNPFDISYQGMTLKAQEYAMQDSTVFQIIFPDKRQQLLVTRTQGLAGKHWTSVPEGRQKEAEEIGELIMAKIKKN